MSVIPLFSVWMNKNVHKEVRKVLESGFIGQGPKVEEFESVLKDYIGNPYISSKKKKGMGLGIFIAKNLIANINVKVLFRNNISTFGSTVEIHLNRNNLRA